MTATLRSPHSPMRAAVELLASMRFAISLLTVICIASVIGTVLKQGEPLNNYVNQFGPFWTEVFGAMSLYKVYSAWWFLLILAFLVTSTSLCIARNTPKILQDLKVYKENIREQSLQAFGLKAQATVAAAPAEAAQSMGQALVRAGWKVKLQSRQTPQGEGWMVAAKAGAANKLGYIAAHSAIVLVCVGGLLDGDLMVRAQMWLGGKSLYSGAGLIGEVPEQHRLSVRNPTFRGNLMVGEGMMANTAILNQPGGVLLQDLPFGIELKKFVVEHYSTGMPKLFASEIVIHDRETGAQTPARVEVNHPASYKGIEIYQSSFDDGGSSVKLRALPMASQARAFEVEGVIGGSTELSNGKEKLALEYTALRVMNVENVSGGAGLDPRKVDLRAAIDQRLGAANKPGGNKDLRNVGPSITYKLRDAAGQAREFHNYMQPVDLGEGVPVFLLGLRESPSEPFRYLRIPADAQLSKDDFFRLKNTLLDAAARERAVLGYAKKAVPPNRSDLAEQLAHSARRAIDLFAGVDGEGGKTRRGGLEAVADFMQSNVPENERERASEVLLRIVNGVLFEMLQTARESAGLAPLPPTDESTRRFMALAIMGLSDIETYPAPVAFELVDFKQVQASVFQVARAPGKNLVYLGCALLIIGIFAMLYVRERRLWVWLSPAAPGAAGASAATLAMSSNRKTMDSEREFEQLRHSLLGDPT